MLWERHVSEELPHINLIPMVDVVLCLLIFFMAATRLYDWDENQFSVSVPEVSDARPLTAAPRELSLVILAPGQVDVGGATLDLEALVGFLKAARARFADQGVVVRGDASLAYQDLADVLSTCETAGIRDVRLAVRPREGSSSPLVPTR